MAHITFRFQLFLSFPREAVTVGTETLEDSGILSGCLLYVEESDDYTVPLNYLGVIVLQVRASMSFKYRLDHRLN